MGLVKGVYNQGIMVFVAVALEGLKILCLTSANTARWQSARHRFTHIKESIGGFFGRSKRKVIRDPELLRAVLDSSKKNRKAVALYSAYVLTAFLSISASFGYVLETVDRATTYAMITTNTDAISIYKQTGQEIDIQITQNKQTILDYNKYIDSLDLFSLTYQRDRDKYQKLIDALQVKNSALLDKKLVNNDKIQVMSIADVSVVKETKKTMYQLMGEVLSIPDKSIMFILLYLLAILIEVGIFITSPHFHKMDEEDILPPSNKKLKEGENVSTTDRNNRTTVIYPVDLSSSSDPVIPVEPSPSSNDVSHVPLSQADFEAEQQRREEENGTGEFIEASEVIETPVEEEEVRLTQSATDRFVTALFNNNGKPYLKDKNTASSEARIRKIEGFNIFDFMTRTKIKGLPMIEFRSNEQQWYPNFTSEVIKFHLKEAPERKYSNG
jgi:hypothetical protein